MFRRICSLVLGLLFVPFCYPQKTSQAQVDEHPPSKHGVPPAVPELAKPVRISTVPALPVGLPIKLRLTRTINPRDVKPGDEVPFELATDLYYRDVLLAKESTEVMGLVREAHGSGMFGEGSRLSLVITMMSLLDGEGLPLQGKVGARGGSDPQSDKYGSEALGASAWNPPMGIALAVFWWAWPGENLKLPKDTLVVASVVRETSIDIAALRQLQPPKARGEKATVKVVRGWFGAVRSADFYCNGIPIAHLPYKRLLELKLEQGWYRFSIKPKKAPAELFLVSGQTYNLAADSRTVAAIPLTEVNDNTTNFRLFGKKRDFAELLHDAKPLSLSDFYGNTCSPLAEELVEPTPPLKPVSPGEEQEAAVPE